MIFIMAPFHLFMPCYLGGLPCGSLYIKYFHFGPAHVARSETATVVTGFELCVRETTFMLSGC